MANDALGSAPVLQRVHKLWGASCALTTWVQRRPIPQGRCTSSPSQKRTDISASPPSPHMLLSLSQTRGEHAHCLREYMRAVRSSAGSALGEVLVSATEKAQEWRSKQQPTKELLNFAYLVWVAIVLPISAAHFVTLSRCTQDINASIPADLWQSQYGFKEWLLSTSCCLRGSVGFSRPAGKWQSTSMW